MLEQARRDTPDKYDTLHDARDTHDTRVGNKSDSIACISSF